MRVFVPFLALLAIALATGPSPVRAQHDHGHDHAHEHAPAATAAAASPVAHPLATVTVHKSPYCGCCEQWVQHLRAEGFEVRIVDTADMTPVKQRVGVPPGKGSCHTAEVDGYFVEGHVPAADIKRLLAERPQARGLAVPGMPMGSPGMEMPDGRVQPYTVELIAPDGSASAYARHGD